MESWKQKRYILENDGVTNRLYVEVRYTRLDYDRRNESLRLHQESIAKSDQTHPKQHKTFYETNQ